MNPPVPALVLTSPHSNVYHMLDPGGTLREMQAVCGQNHPDMRITLLHELQRGRTRARRPCRKCWPVERIPAHG
jgi:hypothetical protein